MICKECGEDKPQDQYRTAYTKHGFDRLCIDCRRAYQAAKQRKYLANVSASRRKEINDQTGQLGGGRKRRALAQSRIDKVLLQQEVDRLLGINEISFFRLCHDVLGITNANKSGYDILLSCYLLLCIKTGETPSLIKQS